MSNLNHPENCINDAFWMQGSIRSDAIERGVPTPAAAWQNVRDELGDDAKMTELHALLVNSSPDVDPEALPEAHPTGEDEAPADFVGEAYTPNERPAGGRKWLGRLGGIGLFGAAATAVALFGSAYVEHENLVTAQEKSAVREALQDPDTLGALGVCAVELEAQAQFLESTNDRSFTKRLPSAKQYEQGAELAGSWNIPCESHVMKAASQATEGYKERVNITAYDVTGFNLSDVCENIDHYSSEVKQDAYSVNMAHANAMMAQRAGIEC
jgi:hypothetical protein